MWCNLWTALPRLANTKPQPYNIRTCLQQLHDLSKVLHNTHLIIVKLKQKFLFSFRINMKRVRDLSPEQRLKLAPLFVAQEKYCRQLLTYHEILDPGQSEIKTKLLLELRKILLMQIRVLADNPNSTRAEMAEKLDEVKNLSFLVCERVPLWKYQKEFIYYKYLKYNMYIDICNSWYNFVYYKKEILSQFQDVHILSKIFLSWLWVWFWERMKNAVTSINS